MPPRSENPLVYFYAEPIRNVRTCSGYAGQGSQIALKPSCAELNPAFGGLQAKYQSLLDESHARECR